MRHLLVAIISFFCIVDYNFPVTVKNNEAAGCEIITVWENAHGVPRYWFMHCPDEASINVQAHGYFTDVHI